jgi:hypothetical protein
MPSPLRHAATIMEARPHASVVAEQGKSSFIFIV